VTLLRQIEVSMAQEKSAPVACRDAGWGRGRQRLLELRSPIFISTFSNSFAGSIPDRPVEMSKLR
jgi:hypothetical protein